jgi:hypothetical protein
VKYTLLSKWTALILTLATLALAYGGYLLITGPSTLGSMLPNYEHNPGAWTAGAIIAAFLIYALAWLVAFTDSIQERAYTWSIALIVLLPVLVGPLLYSFIGPRNTR